MVMSKGLAKEGMQVTGGIYEKLPTFFVIKVVKYNKTTIIFCQTGKNQKNRIIHRVGQYSGKWKAFIAERIGV